jgi:hypothetical protein
LILIYERSGESKPQGQTSVFLDILKFCVKIEVILYHTAPVLLTGVSPGKQENEDNEGSRFKREIMAQQHTRAVPTGKEVWKDWISTERRLKEWLRCETKENQEKFTNAGQSREKALQFTTHPDTAVTVLALIRKESYYPIFFILK